MRVVLMASGRGTNVQALLAARAQWNVDVHFAGLVSDKPNAPALNLAQASGIPTAVVVPAAFRDRTTWNQRLGSTVADFAPDLVVMAGFMRIVSLEALCGFRAPAINVHPALLPSFPGAHAVRDALAAGVRVTGVTVHQVIPAVDAGPILEQEALRILTDDDEATLAARVHQIEHRLLPRVVHALAIFKTANNAHGAAPRPPDTEIRRKTESPPTPFDDSLPYHYRAGLALLDGQGT